MTCFDVIAYDWPWQFEVYSEATGEGRSAQSHYNTKALTWEDHARFIEHLWPVMAPNCAILVWMTRPSQDAALDDIRYNWNQWIADVPDQADWAARIRKIAKLQNKFSRFGTPLPRHKNMLVYKTELFTLVKLYRNGEPFKSLGYYSRANTEPCMLFMRGSLPREDKSVNQVIPHIPHDVPERWRHSHKPPEWRKRVERLWPNKRYLELFARPYLLEESPAWTFKGIEITGNNICEDLRLLAEQ